MNAIDRKHWGTDDDPWVAKVRALLASGDFPAVLGVTTIELAAELLGPGGADQATTVRIGMCLRSLGWLPQAQARERDEDGHATRVRRYRPESHEAAPSTYDHSGARGREDASGGASGKFANFPTDPRAAAEVLEADHSTPHEPAQVAAPSLEPGFQTGARAPRAVAGPIEPTPAPPPQTGAGMEVRAAAGVWRQLPGGQWVRASAPMNRAPQSLVALFARRGEILVELQRVDDEIRKATDARR